MKVNALGAEKNSNPHKRAVFIDAALQLDKTELAIFSKQQFAEIRV